MCNKPHSDRAAGSGSVTDLAFMEARACLISIAAYLDRSARHGEGDDFRNQALRDGLRLVASGSDEPVLAKSLLEWFSDHSEPPLEAAPALPVSGVPRTLQGEKRT